MLFLQKFKTVKHKPMYLKILYTVLKRGNKCVKMICHTISKPFIIH